VFLTNRPGDSIALVTYQWWLGTDDQRNDRITRQMHSDDKKWRSLVALLFASGDLRRWLAKEIGNGKGFDNLDRCTQTLSHV
jgi:hypothetical protein